MEAEVVSERTSAQANRSKMVVLLSNQRTGSTMVVQRLNTHPDILFVGALFSLKGWRGEGLGRQLIQKGLSPEWNDLNFRVAHHTALLDRIKAVRQVNAFGLKHHISGAEEVTQTIVDDPEIAVIHLNRENILACFSSDEMIDVKWTESVGFEGAIKTQFQPKRFERYMERRLRTYQKWRDLIASRQGPNMEIEYTEARLPDGMDRIVRFLGYDPSRLGPQGTKKRNPDQISARFTNPETVERFLVERGLESWLTET